MDIELHEKLKNEIEQQLAGNHDSNLTKYSYLGDGASKFESFTQNPNYHSYNEEIELIPLLRREIDELSRQGIHVIEFGPGDCAKSRQLIRTMSLPPISYTGIEMSIEMSQIGKTRNSLAQSLSWNWVNGDFTDPRVLKPVDMATLHNKRLVAIFGNTIANEPDIKNFLNNVIFRRNNTYGLVGIELFEGDPRKILAEYATEENRQLTVQPLRLAGFNLDEGQLSINFNEIRRRIEEWFHFDDGRSVLLSSTIKPTLEEWEQSLESAGWTEIGRQQLNSQIMSLIRRTDQQ